MNLHATLLALGVAGLSLLGAAAQDPATSEAEVRNASLIADIGGHVFKYGRMSVILLPVVQRPLTDEAQSLTRKFARGPGLQLEGPLTGWQPTPAQASHLLGQVMSDPKAPPEALTALGRAGALACQIFGVADGAGRFVILHFIPAAELSQSMSCYHEPEWLYDLTWPHGGTVVHAETPPRLIWCPMNGQSGPDHPMKKVLLTLGAVLAVSFVMMWISVLVKAVNPHASDFYTPHHWRNLFHRAWRLALIAAVAWIVWEAIVYLWGKM